MEKLLRRALQAEGKKYMKALGSLEALRARSWH